MPVSACRFRVGPCTGPGSQKNHDGSVFTSCATCEGVSDAPAEKPRKEKSAMPNGTPAPVGTCPDCGDKLKKLRTSKHSPDRRLCAKCINRLTYHANKAGKTRHKPATPPTAATVPREPRPARIAPQRPAQAPAEAVTIGGAIFREPSPAACVVLRFTCHEPADVMALLIASRGLSCSMGVER